MPDEEEKFIVVNTDEPLEYPLVGYVYGADGFHDGKHWLKNQAELEAFLAEHGKNPHELMITDAMDFAVLHTKKGAVLWPKPQ